MSKILDIKEVRNILIDNENSGGLSAGLGVAKRIGDYFAAQYPEIYTERLADWEKELLAPLDPTPWHVSRGEDVEAKFRSKEEAVAYLIDSVGNVPSNVKFGIVHNSRISVR